MQIDLFPTYQLAKALKRKWKSLLPFSNKMANLQSPFTGHAFDARLFGQGQTWGRKNLYHEEWILDGGKEKIDTNRAVE